jgi:hypothetical protein
MSRFFDGCSKITIFYNCFKKSTLLPKSTREDQSCTQDNKFVSTDFPFVKPHCSFDIIANPEVKLSSLSTIIDSMILTTEEVKPVIIRLQSITAFVNGSNVRSSPVAR